MRNFSWKFFAVSACALTFFLSASAYAAAPSVVTVVVPAPADRAVTLTWTNPAEVDFTGTMVRFSTTAFPATTSDGTLVSDVAGVASGTSSVTHSDLANGTIYYYSLFSHNAALEYSAAVNTQQLVMAASFTEDFEGLSTANIDGQNDWDVLGGSWSVVDTAGEQTLKSTADTSTFQVNRVTNGGSVATFSNQMVRVDWKGSTASTPGQVFIRAQSASADAGGYFMWQSGGTVRINYKTTSGAPQTQLVAAAFTPSNDTWYTYEFSVVNNGAGLPVLTGYVWARGAAKPSTPTLQVTDTIPRFAQGVFSLGKTGSSLAEYDNVSFHGMPGDSLATATPADGSVVLAWTNPTYATYAGTVIRVSTSAYPASTTDGTLVANVTGTSAGTSTATHTGLTNGTTHYYTLFPYDASGVYGTPLYLRQVPYPVLFTENFTSLDAATLAGQNGWTSPAGTWAVTDLLGNNVATGTGTQTYPTNKAVNGTYESTTQVVTTRFRSTAASNNTGFIWLRSRPNGKEGYLVWHNGNAWTVSYRSASTLTAVGAAATTAAPPMEADAWFNLEASVVNNGSDLPVFTVFVWKEGAERPATPTLTVTDTVNRSANGYVAIGRGNVSETAYYDDIGLYGVAPGVTITSPAALVDAATDVATISIIDDVDTFFVPYIQTSTTLTVTAAAGTTVAAGGGVEFVLNEDLSTERTVIDLTAPYSATFAGLEKAEYTIDAYLLQADGSTRVDGATYHDERTNVAIGDIITAIGDSITEGTTSTIDGGAVLSWLDADAGTVSLDNRQFPQYGAFGGGTYKESFLTDMNDKLATLLGYPVFIMNEGVSGAEASLYATNQINAAWTVRQAALQPNKWLINLGANDAPDGDSAATYQTNIAALITTLITTHGAAASQIYLAKPTHREDMEVLLASYAEKVDDTRTDLGLAGGPDYYSTFENYHDTEYEDATHPNVTGFVRMARIAALSMAQPVLYASMSGRNISLVWDNMALREPTVAGYRVSYGTDPSALTSTVTVGDRLGYLFSGLPILTNYYFAVTAYDNDVNDVSYSDASTVSRALFAVNSSSNIVPSSTPSNGSPDPIPGDTTTHDGVVDTGTDTGADTDTDDATAARTVVAGGTWGFSPYNGLPQVTSSVQSGTYIRGTNFSTVYYIDEDGYRHPFTNAQIFATYDVTFDDVVFVTDATLPELPLGAPMLPKAGTILVKIVSDPRVFVVEADPTNAFRPLLRWIASEEIAISLYGDDWADSVIDVDTALFGRFGAGATIPTNAVLSSDALPLETRASLAEAVL